MILEHLGYESVTATNSEQALSMATSQPPDLILLDVSRPQLDGLAAARLIRQNPKTHSIPIIALTGRNSFNGRDECLKSGCDDYISKPFLPEQLAPRIEKLSMQLLIPGLLPN
jgi:CheY-like chemotaxis protein